MTVSIRIGLAILFLDEFVVGAWNAVAPRSFYRHFPTVDLTPPYSEHFARDFGGATLGLALLLGIALVRPKQHFVIPATLAFLTFAVPHFLFHVTHLDGMTATQKIGLTTANAFVVLVGVAIIVVTVARERRAQDRRST